MTLTPQERMARGMELYRRRHFQEAIDLFTSVLVDHPGHLQALSHLAECHRYLRNPGQVDAVLSELILLNPENPWPWYRRGRARMALERFDEAIDDLTRAELLEDDLVFDQGLSELFLVRADCYEAKGALRLALADFQMYGLVSGKRYVGDREVARLQRRLKGSEEE